MSIKILIKLSQKAVITVHVKGKLLLTVTVRGSNFHMFEGLFFLLLEQFLLYCNLRPFIRKHLKNYAIKTFPSKIKFKKKKIF